MDHIWVRSVPNRLQSLPLRTVQATTSWTALCDELSRIIFRHPQEDWGGSCKRQCSISCHNIRPHSILQMSLAASGSEWSLMWHWSLTELLQRPLQSPVGNAHAVSPLTHAVTGHDSATCSTTSPVCSRELVRSFFSYFFLLFLFSSLISFLKCYHIYNTVSGTVTPYEWAFLFTWLPPFAVSRLQETQRRGGRLGNGKHILDRSLTDALVQLLHSPLDQTEILD